MTNFKELYMIDIFRLSLKLCNSTNRWRTDMTQRREVISRVPRIQSKGYTCKLEVATVVRDQVGHEVICIMSIQALVYPV